ncbi:MAG: hypothetical protein ACRD0J_17610 [Acidimicrobiales bacterium]
MRLPEAAAAMTGLAARGELAAQIRLAMAGESMPALGAMAPLDVSMARNLRRVVQAMSAVVDAAPEARAFPHEDGNRLVVEAVVTCEDVVAGLAVTVPQDAPEGVVIVIRDARNQDSAFLYRWPAGIADGIDAFLLGEFTALRQRILSKAMDAGQTGPPWPEPR